VTSKIVREHGGVISFKKYERAGPQRHRGGRTGQSLSYVQLSIWPSAGLVRFMSTNGPEPSVMNSHRCIPCFVPYFACLLTELFGHFCGSTVLINGLSANL
jgi:hypothetical protein